MSIMKRKSVLHTVQLCDSMISCLESIKCPLIDPGGSNVITRSLEQGGRRVKVGEDEGTGETTEDVMLLALKTEEGATG